MKTHFYQDLRISCKEKNYPVIIFNHGLNSYTMQNSVLCADLASSGYIVVSVGHPHMSGAIRYSDGRIIKIDQELYKAYSKSMANANKKGNPMVLAKGKYADETVMGAVGCYYDNCQFLNDDIQVWVDDTRFIANQLEKLKEGNIPSPFKNKLKLELGIGITGHSYGGATAAQACLMDSRFICGIDIDGGSYGNYRNKDIQKPFMVLGSRLMENMSRTTYLFDTEDTYMTILENAAHFGFTDALFFGRQLGLMGMVGKREKYEFRYIVTTYHLKFFEKYLLRKPGNKDRRSEI